MNTLIGKRFRKLGQSTMVKVLVENSMRIQVMNLVTGNREWIDRLDFAASYREMYAVERNVRVA